MHVALRGGGWVGGRSRVGLGVWWFLAGWAAKEDREDFHGNLRFCLTFMRLALAESRPRSCAGLGARVASFWRLHLDARTGSSSALHARAATWNTHQWTRNVHAGHENGGWGWSILGYYGNKSVWRRLVSCGRLVWSNDKLRRRSLIPQSEWRL